MPKDLDDNFLLSLTSDNIKKEFKGLLERKTDIYDGQVKIAKGSDNIDSVAFSNNIDKYINIICEKGKKGSYIFSPLKEIIVPKPPFERHQLEEAKAAKKTRTISMSTIQDTIFQILLSKVLCPYSEDKFINIDKNSFGYRKEKSSKMAVQIISNSIKDGYLYILDADIEAFFDKINHKLLQEKMELFFGKENIFIQKYLFRFINTNRIVEGRFLDYQLNKKNFSKRMIGIPQGGVISGLLANVFLYDFDLYVVNDLIPQYNFRYYRYADDFVLLFKDRKNIEEVYKQVRDYLYCQGLMLHELGGEKTKILDLSIKTGKNLDFLGFEISPKYLRIKDDNVKKFKNRILKIIGETKIYRKNEYLNSIAKYINPKIVGLENLISKDGICLECGKVTKKRSWLGYFMIIDDVRLLRDIDTWIRSTIYEDFYMKTKCRLRKKDLFFLKDQLISIEKTYYKYKKQERRINKIGYCNCEWIFDPKAKVMQVKKKIEV